MKGNLKCNKCVSWCSRCKIQCYVVAPITRVDSARYLFQKMLTRMRVVTLILLISECRTSLGLNSLLWIRIRIHLAVLDPDPYWECGSGSMEMDPNKPRFNKKIQFSVTRILIRLGLANWIRIRTNTDPQHWLKCVCLIVGRQMKYVSKKQIQKRPETGCK